MDQKKIHITEGMLRAVGMPDWLIKKARPNINYCPAMVESTYQSLVSRDLYPPSDENEPAHEPTDSVDYKVYYDALQGFLMFEPSPVSHINPETLRESGWSESLVSLFEKHKTGSETPKELEQLKPRTENSFDPS